MSVDRTVAAGEWGRSKIRCNGTVDGRRCTQAMVGGFREGVKSARSLASAAGWQVAVRVQYAANGSDLRDFCPAHHRSA